jgi:P4 family phage/plasmid primase-like protien
MAPDQNKNLLQEAKFVLTVPELLRRIGKCADAPSNKVIRSPIRDDDKTPSFSIYGDGTRWKDHGTGQTGDSYDLYQILEGLDSKQAFVPFVELAGLGHLLSSAPSSSKARAQPTFNWTKCVEAITEDQLQELAAWRGYSIESCHWLRDHGHIGSHDGHFAFPVGEPHGALTGCHYLADQDNKIWKFSPGGPAHPLIIGDIDSAIVVHVFESTWDGLALYDRMSLWETEDQSLTAIIITRGATNTAKIRGLVHDRSRVFVWPQNDEQKSNGKIPSEEWFTGIRANIGCAFQRVNTPSNYSDLNDWTRDGATPADLDEAIGEAKLVEPLSQPATNGNGNGNGKTGTKPDRKDEKFVESFYADLFKQSIPPVRVWDDTWYVYSDGVWAATPRDIYRKTALEIMPVEIRTHRKAKEILDHTEARSHLDHNSLKGAYCYDGDDILLCVANGVLRIRAGEEPSLQPYTPDHRFTLKLAANYDPNALAPIFEKTLVDLLPDSEDRELFLMFCGSILLPSSKYECALCCYGESRTGKSTVASGVAAAIGPEATQYLTLGQICSTNGYSLPNLKNALLNVSTEVDTLAMESSEDYKRIVSGEPVEMRPIYGHPVKAVTNVKLLALANHLPRFKHGTDAELARLRIIKFGNKLSTPDPAIKMQIAAERDGIFRLLVEYLEYLLRLKAMPAGGAESQATLARFAVTNDPLASFVSRECVLDAKAKVGKDALRDAFREHLDRLGIPDQFGDSLFKHLYDRYPDVQDGRIRINGVRERIVVGIALKEEP